MAKQYAPVAAGENSTAAAPRRVAPKPDADHNAAVTAFTSV